MYGTFGLLAVRSRKLRICRHVFTHAMYSAILYSSAVGYILTVSSRMPLSETRHALLTVHNVFTAPQDPCQTPDARRGHEDPYTLHPSGSQVLDYGQGTCPINTANFRTQLTPATRLAARYWVRFRCFPPSVTIRFIQIVKSDDNCKKICRGKAISAT